jgi:hypothetical protein
MRVSFTCPKQSESSKTDCILIPTFKSFLNKRVHCKIWQEKKRVGYQNEHGWWILTTCEDLEWKGDRAFVFEQSWKKEWIHMWQIQQSMIIHTHIYLYTNTNVNVSAQSINIYDTWNKYRRAYLVTWLNVEEHAYANHHQTFQNN